MTQRYRASVWHGRLSLDVFRCFPMLQASRVSVFRCFRWRHLARQSVRSDADHCVCVDCQALHYSHDSKVSVTTECFTCFVNVYSDADQCLSMFFAVLQWILLVCQILSWSTRDHRTWIQRWMSGMPDIFQCFTYEFRCFAMFCRCSFCNCLVCQIIRNPPVNLNTF
jgi:hypothetical protein